LAPLRAIPYKLVFTSGKSRIPNLRVGFVLQILTFENSNSSYTIDQLSIFPEGFELVGLTVCFKTPTFSPSQILIVQLDILPFTGTVVVSLGSVVDGISDGVVSSAVVGLGVAV